ncbi:MAG: hypothetical protein HOD16_04730, partial [Nitrospina sp.]|nr:hypothetical protein [Nitrospina sp.]
MKKTRQTFNKASSVTSINDNIWKECNARIKEKISAENYSIWFEPMRLHAIT